MDQAFYKAADEHGFIVAIIVFIIVWNLFDFLGMGGTGFIAAIFAVYMINGMDWKAKLAESKKVTV